QSELEEILGGETRQINLAKNPPTVIMLVGLQGAGKTTLAGKLSKHLKQEGHTPMLVAADLQRPNAVKQLEVNGERAGVPVFAPHTRVSAKKEHTTGEQVQVSKHDILESMNRQHYIVIIHTHGRLSVDLDLMQQSSDIRAATNPYEVLFVTDDMIGQDAVATA